MVDSWGREINYMRISVTDRCNLRCLYCMPEEGIEGKLNHQGILSLEELAYLTRIAARVGIKKVRLTGGEPLVRRNIEKLIEYIAEIPEIDDIALTTNGIKFKPMADRLKKAGLKRVNFSLDSLQPEKFRYITRGGDIRPVKEGIWEALELGLNPVKINTVVIKGFNDDEIIDFASLAYDYPLHIRFIEFMPVGDLLFWHEDKLIKSREIKEKIEKKFPLTVPDKITGNGPAKYFKIEGGQGSIGFISPMSNHFCAACNRIRLTADGKLRGCLYSKEEVDLWEALKKGASDEELILLFLETINNKPVRHRMDAGWGRENERKMYQIGG
ncbi:cyclic pyranopterin monophosphate synthase subunit MoaA [Thermosyntropha lipolytica DSM 11003]|uniref:GTP 3',8-cyclase n=1 Tax=Thermosyntropha lipolytica DSM 11003 TaxID=1123382 RepID=A0A1M5JEP3_9FIRM|nr:GTP 3',8-cyclase MoaA [Thermosyntropha lipolytica]SHG38845.1 cyclic pyranopterin monophosphate synthase subunit MoaA [Thermosyntropha lipolytica DSM 11003]